MKTKKIYKEEEKKRVLKMGMEPIEEWIEELKKRGIRTFVNKELSDDLRDRTMIIKAKYAGVIRKRSKKLGNPVVWEVT